MPKRQTAAKTLDPAEPLKNSKHEAIAREISKGRSPTEAYKEIYRVKTTKSAKVLVYRMLADSGILERCLWMKRQTANGNVMDNIERRERLARIVRCDLNAIDLSKDGDLIQEKSHTEFGVKLKLPGKRECIMSDAELSGELVQNVRHSGNIDANIAVTALSEDKWLAMLEKKQAAIARRHSPKELGNGEAT